MTGTTKKPVRKLQFGKIYRETKAEVKKVTWPTKKELVQHTEVVITSIILIGAALWIVDSLFAKIVDLVLMK